MGKWLFKSEPSAYSLGQLERDGQTIWDGVRNYQARNFLRDEVKTGDRVFFYHSNVSKPAIEGTAKIIETGVADPAQFDRNSPYYDEKSTRDDPRWITVRIQFEQRFPEPIYREELKKESSLQSMELLRKGSRLSIQPVTEDEWKKICSLAKQKGAGCR